jgi:hypothetical protein
MRHLEKKALTISLKKGNFKGKLKNGILGILLCIKIGFYKNFLHAINGCARGISQEVEPCKSYKD